MKRILLSIGIGLSLCNATGQNQEKTLDDALVTVHQASVTSGIIYERVVQFANLYNFNREPDFDTADYTYFKQALSEMHRASNEVLFMNASALDSLMQQETNHVVPLGILNTDFQLLNYRFEEVQQGGLTYDENTQEFSQIPGQPPFYTLHTTVIAPLHKAIAGTGITYKIDPTYLFQNQQQRIKTLTADFGDGVSRNLINNYNLQTQQIQVNYNTDGDKIATYQIIYEDNTSITTKSSIYFKYQTQIGPKTLSPYCAGDTYKENGRIIADIPFTGYEVNDPTILAEIDYRIYYSENDAGNNQLDNPIIILDGFDPGDKRKIEDCDCGQDLDCAAANKENGQFNPDLHNSMYEFQFYLDDISQNKNALETLRREGFDVIMVNHPTYDTVDVNTGEMLTIDGGAYYIESNAMALIKLLQETKSRMASTGSTAQIKLVGPSMGGQISRYALAYMEAMEEQTQDSDTWDHNVSHWVSIDSPHLGANIPLGDQALIFLIKEMLSDNDNDAAEDFYDKQLSSPAAKQQLIEFHRQAPGQSHHHVDQNLLNAQTLLQGFSQDRGNSSFTEHYNNQAINGLPNSNGFPTKSKNLAIINGSLTGSRLSTLPNEDGGFYSYAADGEKVLGVKSFARVRINLPLGNIVFRTHIATLDSHFMSSGANERVAKFYKIPTTKTVIAPNNNQRGTMDNVPGGWFLAQQEIADAVTGSRSLHLTSDATDSGTVATDVIGWFHDDIIGLSATDDTQVRTLNPINSFIPSFSAIAHLNPDQDWNNPLNFDLTCDSNRLTPFDSYYGESINTRHTSFNQDSINWLIESLKLPNGQVLPPQFPVDISSFSSPSTMCVGDIVTIGFEDECKVATAPTFIIHGDHLRIVSQNGYSAQVEALSNGVGYIQIILNNSVGPAQGFSRQIQIGTPDLDSAVATQLNSGTFLSIYPPSLNCDAVGLRIDGVSRYDLVQEVEMRKPATSVAQWDADQRSGRDNTVGIYPDCNELFVFEVRMRNACGWSEWKEFSYDLDQCTTDCTNGNSGNSGMSDNFIISPVPADTDITITKKQNPTWTFTPTQCYTGLTDPYGNTICDYHIGIEMYDMSDLRQIFIKRHLLGTSFDVSGLLPGVYLLKIWHGGQLESHQIVVQ
jgi:hypothetical protein